MFKIGDLVKVVNTTHSDCRGTVGIIDSLTQGHYHITGGMNRLKRVFGIEFADMIIPLFAGKINPSNHECESIRQEGLDIELELLCKKGDITKEFILTLATAEEL